MSIHRSRQLERAKTAPLPRYNKGDLASATAHTTCRDFVFTCVILESRWNGHIHIYLVEDVQDAAALLVPEDHLSDPMSIPC
jgi:hypothetical protein